MAVVATGTERSTEAFQRAFLHDVIKTEIGFAFRLIAATGNLGLDVAAVQVGNRGFQARSTRVLKSYRY